MPRKIKEPETAEEWQEAANAADFMLCVVSARIYGLITGGPSIDADRCIELLTRGELAGY
jgi:hypothetical protein